jgi:hypothetical protein
VVTGGVGPGRVGEWAIRDITISVPQYKDWTVEDWRNVVISDDTKVNRFRADGAKMVLEKTRFFSLIKSCQAYYQT